MTQNLPFTLSETIAEKDITTVNLSLLLEQIDFEHRIEDDDSIYVTETGIFPFWIRVLPKSHVLIISTYFSMEKDIDEAKIHMFCNAINTDMILPTVNWKDGRFWMCYPIYIKDQMVKSHLIRLMRFFSDGVDKIKPALRDCLNE